jgi:6-phosphogluconolactonase
MIRVFKDEPEVLMAIADFFIEKAQHAIVKHGEFNVSLAGGSSPKKLYELLSSTNFRNKTDWRKINFFFGDERFVPADDEQSNALMVKRALFDPLNIAASHIFTIDTSLSPDDSARKYMETINIHFKNNEVRFDLILLGLGSNAHTASLFPYTPVLSDLTPSIKPVYTDETSSCRLTMTAPLINQARHIAFLVYGEAKAEAIKNVLHDKMDVNKYPAQLICPKDGDVQWFLDKPAASQLQEEDFDSSRLKG